MEPGIYRDIPFNDYLAIDAISNSRLSQLAKSPKHFQHNVGMDAAKHLVIGQLVHCGRLEPLALSERYVVCPDFHKLPENATADGKPSTSRYTSFVKEREAQFAAATNGCEIVPREWFDEVLAIVRSLASDQRANELFNDPGEVELTLVWDDDETGIRCKARIDKLCRNAPRFADLKTCADLSAFTRSIARYGYHRQLAHYQAGWIALTGEVLDPWIVAVEKAAPFCVQTAPLHEEALDAGCRQRRELLELLADCRESNEWPGPPSPDFWRIPEWALGGADPIQLVVNGESLEV